MYIEPVLGGVGILINYILLLSQLGRERITWVDLCGTNLRLFFCSVFIREMRFLAGYWFNGSEEKKAISIACIHSGWDVGIHTFFSIVYLYTFMHTYTNIGSGY